MDQVLTRRDGWGPLLEAIPDAAIIANSDGRIVMVNHNSELLTGYSRDELIGSLVEMLMPERFRENHVGHRSRYSEEPAPRAMGQGIDLFCLRKTGTEIAVEISLGPMHLPEGFFVVTTIRRKRG